MVTIITTSYSNPDVQHLVQQLDAELLRRHGTGQTQYNKHLHEKDIGYFEDGF